jgi:hypothetical protein
MDIKISTYLSMDTRIASVFDISNGAAGNMAGKYLFESLLLAFVYLPRSGTAAQMVILFLSFVKT